jgi:hypothetical protein
MHIKMMDFARLALCVQAKIYGTKMAHGDAGKATLKRERTVTHAAAQRDTRVVISRG